MRLANGRYRILLHLESQDDPRKVRESAEAPYRLCQKGIAEAVDLSQNRTSEIIRDLIDEGWVKEEVHRIVGLQRRRKVYYLTSEGLKKAKEIKNELRNKEVTIITDSSEYEVELDKINSYIESRKPLIIALNHLSENEVIDLSKIESQEKDIFVGREEEMNLLLNEWNQVKKDGVRTVLIRGEAGIGKTRLVNEFRNQVLSEEEIDFFAGKGHYGSLEPYLSFKDAFEKIREMEKNPFLEFSREVEENNRFENYDERLDVLKKRNLLFSKTTENIRSSSEGRPIVIFLDDLQWADKTSLMLFHYLADKLEESPVFLMGAYRPEDVENDNFLNEMVQRMGREHLFEELELEPLKWEHTKKIIQSLVGKFNIPDDFIQMIHEISEGNPLFSKELVKQMLEEDITKPGKGEFPTDLGSFDMPVVIDNIIERRIKDLNREHLKVLQVGSVIGEEIQLPLLRSVTKMENFDLLEAIDIFTSSGLWESNPEEDYFSFTHGLIHLSIYESIPKDFRKDFHRLVAESAEEVFKDNIEEYYSDIGYHYKEANEFSKAWVYYRKAGKKAEQMFAHEDAVEMYKRSLDLATKIDLQKEKYELLEKLGDIHTMIGKYNEGLKFYEKIPKEEIGSENRQRIYRKFARVYNKKGKFDESQHYVEKGLEECSKGDSIIEKARLLKRKGWNEFRRGEYDSAERSFSEAFKICEKQADKKDLGDLYHALGTVYVNKSDYDKALDYLKKGLEIRKEIDDIDGEASSLSNLGNIHLFRGEVEEALDKFQESLKIMKKIGDKGDIVKVILNIGNSYLKKGEVEKAFENYQKSKKLYEEMGDKRGISISMHNLGNYYLIKGDLDKALKHYKKTNQMSKKHDLKRGVALSNHNLATVYEEKDEIKKAKKHCRKSIEISRDIGDKLQLINSQLLLAEMFVDEKKYEKATQKVEKSLEIAKEIGADREEGMSRRVLGIIYRKKGELESAKKEFEKGKELLQDVNAKKELAELLLDYSFVLKESSEEEKYEEHVEKGLSFLEEMGMDYWVEKYEEKYSLG